MSKIFKSLLIFYGMMTTIVLLIILIWEFGVNMLIIKLFLFAVSGLLIGYGLVLQVIGIMDKALSKKTNKLPIGIVCKICGIIILGYLVIHYKTQDLTYGLISFFTSAAAIISWILLARRKFIR